MKARKITTKPAKTGNKQRKKSKPVVSPEDRRKNGQFVKGVSGNPAGRAKGPGRIQELKEAIKRVETKLNNNWLQHQIEKSYDDTALAIALMGRIYPSLKAVEVVGGLAVGKMSEEESSEIQNVLRQRYEIDTKS